MTSEWISDWRGLLRAWWAVLDEVWFSSTARHVKKTWGSQLIHFDTKPNAPTINRRQPPSSSRECGHFAIRLKRWGILEPSIIINRILIESRYHTKRLGHSIFSYRVWPMQQEAGEDGNASRARRHHRGWTSPLSFGPLPYDCWTLARPMQLRSSKATKSKWPPPTEPRTSSALGSSSKVCLIRWHKPQLHPAW